MAESDTIKRVAHVVPMVHCRCSAKNRCSSNDMFTHRIPTTGAFNLRDNDSDLDSFTVNDHLCFCRFN